MDALQIIESLDRIYQDHRVVFWNDVKGEFRETVNDLELADVKVVALEDKAQLALKLEIELEQPAQKYLLYSAAEAPDPSGDVLLDIRHYAREFSADRSWIVLKDLGLENLHLREHLEKRIKFFNNKSRMQALQSLVMPADNEDDLDLKMVSVLVGAEQVELFTITRTIYQEIAEKHDGDLEVVPSCWQRIEKYGLAPFFWQQIEKSFGYRREDPDLQNLLFHLLLSF